MYRMKQELSCHICCKILENVEVIGNSGVLCYIVKLQNYTLRLELHLANAMKKKESFEIISWRALTLLSMKVKEMKIKRNYVTKEESVGRWS